MIKVCFVSYQAIRLLAGGPQTQIFETKKALESLGVSVTFFDMWEKFDPKKFDLIHIFGTGISNYHLSREISKLGVKVVLSPIFFSSHSATFIKSVLKIDKLVLRRFRGLWSDYRLVSDMCTWASAILPNTYSEALLIQKGFDVPTEKIFVVPNGVSEKFINATPDLFRNHYNITNFVLNVGHIGPGRKNILRLVKALNILDLPAVVIGRIENTGEFEKIRSIASSKILFLDWIANDSEMLSSAYAACEVFALPSLFETPGIAALEAALAGAKIVITKYGGTQEYFKEYAEYVDPYSVDSIASGIKNAFEKPKSFELRDLIKENFLWNRIGEKTLNVYLKLLR